MLARWLRTASLRPLSPLLPRQRLPTPTPPLTTLLQQTRPGRGAAAVVVPPQ
jgi:hypothetical protein